MAFKWPDKDPSEKLDYLLDWSAPLGDDTIDTVVWSVVSGGVTLSNESHTEKAATVWVDGGTVSPANEPAKVQCKITTVGGRKFTETGLILIVAK